MTDSRRATLHNAPRSKRRGRFWPADAGFAVLLFLLQPVCVRADRPFPSASRMAAGPRLTAPVKAVYFYRAACAECERVDEWLRVLERGWPEIHVLRLDIADPAAARLHEILCRRFSVPEPLRLVTPAVFTSRGVLFDRDLTFESVANLLAASAGAPFEMPEDFAEQHASAHEAILERFRRWALPTVLLIGLMDGLNPCAFATMIFFVSYLRIGRRSRRTMWALGLSFIASVSLTYFLFGVGFLQVLGITRTRLQWGRFFDAAMGALAVAVGTRLLLEACRPVQGDAARLKNGLPNPVQRRIRELLRGIFFGRSSILALSAFLAGSGVSVLELGCTGQTYFPTLTYLMAVGVYRPRALALLAAYNAAFILPLFALLGLSVSGMHALRAHAWRSRHARLAKSLTGLLAIGVGVFLIHKAARF